MNRRMVRPQTGLLKELGDCQDRIVIELHRTVANGQHFTAENQKAWERPDGQKYRLGTSIAKAISDTTVKGWGDELKRGLALCRKLKAAASAGAVPAHDAELERVRQIAKGCAD